MTELTIDELARQTGMTVRNIRAHQSRGLLPPPEVRGRTGYYGPEHVARIELIRELQADGFNLELIRRMLETAGGESSEVLRFTRTLREPFAEEEPQIIEAVELAEGFGSTDPALIERAIDLGLMRSVGDGRYEMLSPLLMRAGTELVKLGVPAKETLEIVARVRRHADSVAKIFVDVFLRAVWRPFEEEDQPDDRWHEIADSVERLRPLALDAVRAIFGLAMDDAVERQLGRELEREAKRGAARRKR